MSVVAFPLNNVGDIPTMLRDMAAQIEQGQRGEVSTLFLIIPRQGDYPDLFGWGDIHGFNEPLVQLELVKHWLCQNLVSR